ncbi:hypothetical protein RB595_003538 [Gaeumannomyces hyphopodioides]
MVRTVSTRLDHALRLPTNSPTALGSTSLVHRLQSSRRKHPLGGTAAMAASASADATWLPSAGLLSSHEFDRTTIAATLVALVALPVIASYLLSRKDNGIPLINPPKRFQLERKAKMEWAADALRLLNEARERFPNQPFSYLTPWGKVTMLPPDMAVTVKNSIFNFRKRFSEHTPVTISGFGTWDLLDHPDEILQNVVKKHLTKRLNTITEPLALEATFAVDKILGQPSDWVEVPLYDTLLDLIARLSSRVFLGSEVCRDATWLEITSTFTKLQMTSYISLGFSPYLLRPIVAFFDPRCRAVAREKGRATQIVEAELGRRRKEKQECAAKGVAPPSYNDAIEWAEMEAGTTPYDATDLQLNLSFAAIHTSTDLISQSMLMLAMNPGSIEALREELIEVLASGGWTKNSLYHLKLMDSAMKEAQRIKPVSYEGMQRKVMADFVLPNGQKIRKGDFVAVDTLPLWSPEQYENPEKFDMYRFRKMRETAGGEHKAQLVSTVPEHITFGLGKYACPGRFFAANELKIALCHLLLKYDWEVAPGSPTDPIIVSGNPSVDPATKLRYRKRVPEIDLDALEVEAAAE